MIAALPQMNSIANQRVPKWLPPGSLSTACGLIGLVSAVAAISIGLTSRGYDNREIVACLAVVSALTLLPSVLALLVSPSVGDFACVLGLMTIAGIAASFFVADAE